MIIKDFDKIVTSSSEHKNLLPYEETLYPMAAFYSENGEPSEHFSYCRYQVNIGILPFSYLYMQKHNLSEKQYLKENGYDWENLALVTNTPNPYIRCTYEARGSAYPCGCMEYVSSSNSYALLSVEERNQKCPILAYGIGAIFIWNLDVNKIANDLELPCADEVLMNEYFKAELEKYRYSHNSRKYVLLSYKEKEQAFLLEHLAHEKELWRKSIKLQDYELLYKYTSDFVLSYLLFLEQKLQPTDCKKRYLNKDNPIYVSYPWSDSELMDKLCSAFESHNIFYKRDKKDCGYRQNITKFEEEIADAKMIVAIINDKSLHSIDCMYEICKMVENGHFEDRLFPIASLPSSIKRNTEDGDVILNYWRVEYNKRVKQLQDTSNNELLLQELVLCNTIVTEFPKFWKYVCRNNCLTKEALMKDECKVLIDAILNVTQNNR